MCEYFDEMENGSFLEHHGILGQKWGIRRFQNYDGTLKAAGKKRRSEDRVKKRAERKAAKAEKKEAKAQAKAEKAKEDLEKAKAKAIASADLNEIMKLRGSMTTDELKEASARALAIGQVNKNMPKEKSKIDKVIDTLGTGKKALDAVADAHQSLQALRKEFGLDVKSILNDSDDGQMTIGDWMNNKDPDIFDRIKETTGKIAKDAASKANEKYQEHKFQKDLKEARDRKKDADTLDWLENLNGGKKDTPLPKANFDSGFKLKEGDWSVFKNDSSTPKSVPAPIKPKANFDSGFKLGDGDYSIFSSSAARNTKISDVPKPSRDTQRTIDRLIRKGEGVGDVSISDVQQELLRRNGQRLGL